MEENRRQHTIEDWQKRDSPFQFSLCFEDHRALDSWSEWFRTRGIPMALVSERKGGKTMFSLWIKHKGAKYDMVKGTRYTIRWEENGFTGNGNGRGKNDAENALYLS